MGVVGAWGDLVISDGKGKMMNSATSELKTADLVDVGAVAGLRSAVFRDLRQPLSYVSLMFDRITPSTAMKVRLGEATENDETTGYVNHTMTGNDATHSFDSSVTDGISLKWGVGSGSDSFIGVLEMRRLEGNTWITRYQAMSMGTHYAQGIGRKTLAGPLGRVRFLTTRNVATGSVVGIQYQ